MGYRQLAVSYADPPLEILPGPGSEALGGAIADMLSVSPLQRRVDRFPGELDVWVEPVVAERDIYIIHSLSPPVNDRLMALLFLLDACRREGARRITAVIPYLGYARSDRRANPGEPVALSVMADMLDPRRVDRLILMDPHVPRWSRCSVSPCRS